MGIMESLLILAGIVFGSMFLSMLSFIVTKCVCDAKNNSKLSFLKHLKEMEEIDNDNKE